MDPMTNGIQAAGYGPPPGGGGFGPPPGGGGYGAPPGAPPGGGFGPPPGGAPPGAPPGGYGAPPPGFGPPGGGFPPPGGPMMPGAGGDVNTTLPLILAILMIFPCCNLLFGIPALIFAIQAGNLKKTGDLEGARAKAKLTYIIAGIGYALYIIGNILYFVLIAASN